MHRHQPAQRRAVLVEEPLLHALRFCPVHLEHLRDKLCHALVDLAEQPAGSRIERVVEIEHPSVDPVETPASCAGPRDARAEPMGSEQFEQHAMRHASVDDDHAFDPALHNARRSFRPWGSCPPVIVPSAMSFGTSASVTSSISCLFLPSSTPATSVRSSSRLAFMAMAMAPAAVSALTL